MGYCVDCTYWKETTHYCTKHGYSSNGSESCSDFDPKSSGGCYITTALCDVLGFDDDCEVMEKLRMFRDGYLCKHNQYKDLLLEYDTVGRKIAYLISKDIDKTSLCSLLYTNYFRNIINKIDNGDSNEAIDIYSDMVKELRQRYNL